MKINNIEDTTTSNSEYIIAKLRLSNNQTDQIKLLVTLHNETLIFTQCLIDKRRKKVQLSNKLYNEFSKVYVNESYHIYFIAQETHNCF